METDGYGLTKIVGLQYFFQMVLFTFYRNLVSLSYPMLVRPGELIIIAPVRTASLSAAIRNSPTPFVRRHNHRLPTPNDEVLASWTGVVPWV